MKKFTIIPIILIANFLFASTLDQNFQLAKKMYQDTLYEEAIQQFQKIISQYPTSKEAEESQLLVGNCYYNINNFADAEQTYKHLLRAYPESDFVPNALFKLAESQFNQGKYVQSAENYQQLINKYPGSSFAHSSLIKSVKALYLSHQYNETILTALEIAKNYPQNTSIPFVYLVMADAYFDNNIPEKGLSTLQTIISKYKNSEAKWIAVKRLANYYLENDNIEQAINILSDNIDESIPRKYEKDLSLLLGDLLFANNDFQKAMENYQKYLKKFDNETNLDTVSIKIIDCLYKLKSYQKAIEYAQEFVDKFSKSNLIPTAYFRYAQNLFCIKKYTQALQILNKNIWQESPQQYQVEKLKAEIYYQQYQLEQHISTNLYLISNFQQFVKADSIYFHIANIYKDNIKNYDYAINYYQQIINTFPKSNYVNQSLFNIAECYEILEDYENALNKLNVLTNRTIKDKNLEKVVENKINYLKNYKIKESDKAIENLLDNFLFYVTTTATETQRAQRGSYGHGERNNLRKNEKDILISIIEIYRDDLKNYKKALNLIETNKKYLEDKEFVLLSAETYHKVYKKSLLEGDIKLAHEYQIKAKELFVKITKNFPESKEKQFAEYYLTKYQLSELDQTKGDYFIQVQNKYSKFIQQYPDFPKKDEIYYVLANSIIKQKKQSEYSQAIKYLSTIDANSDYFTRASLLLADLYLKTELYNKALEIYQNIKDKPIGKSEQFMYGFAFSLMKTNQNEEAIKYFQDIIYQYPETSYFCQIIEYLGDLFLQLGKTDLAIDYYLQLVEKTRTDKNRRKLRDLYFSIKDYIKVISITSELDTLKNDDKRILAESYFLDGAYQEAISSYKKVISNDTDKEDKLKDCFRLLEIAFISENPDITIEQLKNILELTEQSKDRFSDFSYLDWQKIGKLSIIAYYQDGSRENAERTEKMFKTVLDNDNVKAELLFARAMYYYKLNKNKASKYFQELIKKYPNSDMADDAYFKIALIEMENKKYNKAEQKYEQLLKKYPQSELVNDVHLKLGNLYYLQENYRSALPHYQFIMDNDKDGKLLIQAVKNYALTCRAISEWQSAIDAYQVIIERVNNPDLEPETLFQIGYCYFMDKKYDKAIEIFQQVLPKLRDRELQAETQYWIGESYFGNEDYEQAVAEFLKVTYFYSDFPQWTVSAEIKVGNAYEKMNKFDKAKMIYQKVIKNNGVNNQWGKIAKERLDRIQ